MEEEEIEGREGKRKNEEQSGQSKNILEEERRSKTGKEMKNS